MDRATRAAVVALVALVLASGAFAPVPGVRAQTARSCDEAGLDAALAAGGSNTFNCATATTITVTGTKTIAVSGTILDGGGRLTLSGGNARQVLRVNMSVTATISGLTITGGRAIDGGGGGGIANSGTLTVTGSTVSGNTTTTGGGGGIANSGTLTVTGSTVSGNTTTTGGGGGGIANSGTLTLTGSTVSGNTTTGVGGGILNGGTLSIGGTILSGNTGGVGADLRRVSGTVTDNGSNLIGTASGYTFSMGNGNVFAADPQLGPLADNGGGTQTRLPLPGGIAVDAGGFGCPTTDQREQARPSGAACDIGAAEYQTVRPTLNAARAGAAGEQTVTLTGAGFQRNTLITINGGLAPVQSVSPDGTQLTVRVTGQPVGTSILVIAANPNAAAANAMLAFVAPAAAPTTTRPAAAPPPPGTPPPVGAPTQREVPTPGGMGPPTPTPRPVPPAR